MGHSRRGFAAVAGSLLASVLAGGAAVAAPPVPDLDAVVSHEVRQVLASGVTRVDSWSERLVRRGDQVWTERLLPAAAAQPAHDGAAAGKEAGHKHFDADRSARWLQRTASGAVTLRFVDRAERCVVSVPQAEFDAVGFDGRFDAAAHLVPPALVAQMPVQAGGVEGVGDATWRVQHDAGWTHRVLWSPSRQVALRIDSQRDDGGVRRTVRVQPAAAAPVAPWQQLDGFAARAYDDFMD